MKAGEMKAWELRAMKAGEMKAWELRAMKAGEMTVCMGTASDESPCNIFMWAHN